MKTSRKAFSILLGVLVVVCAVCLPFAANAAIQGDESAVFSLLSNSNVSNADLDESAENPKEKAAQDPTDPTTTDNTTSSGAEGKSGEATDKSLSVSDQTQGASATEQNASNNATGTDDENDNAASQKDNENATDILTLTTTDSENNEVSLSYNKG